VFDKFNMQQDILRINSYYYLHSYDNINHVKSCINTTSFHKPIIHHSIKAQPFITKINRLNTGFVGIISLLILQFCLQTHDFPAHLASRVHALSCRLYSRALRTQLQSLSSTLRLLRSCSYWPIAFIFILDIYFLRLHKTFLFIQSHGPRTMDGYTKADTIDIK